MKSELFETWLIQHLALQLKMDPKQVDPTLPFDRFGLDSAAYVSLSADVEEKLGIRIDPTDLYDHPTIRRFSAHLDRSGALKAFEASQS